MGRRICPDCGKEILDQQTQCPQCGKPLPKKKSKWPIVLLAAVIFLSLFASVAGRLLVFVPPLTGVTESEAKEVLEQLDFSVNTTRALTEDTDAGVVYEQSFWGLHLKGTKKPVITLFVSNGIEVDCPQVVGMTQEQGISALSEAGLECTVQQAYSEDVPLGLIFEQSIQGKTAKGSNVTLHVSKGIGVKAEDQVGRQAAEAVAELQSQGFQVLLQEYADGSDMAIETPVVLSQDKTGILAPGETITLTLNQPSIDITTLTFSTNSVGGVTLNFTIKNKADKVVKYIDFDFSLFDPFGEPANCEIRGTNVYSTRYTGPLSPGSSQSVSTSSPAVYNYNVSAAKIESLTVIFQDDTKQEMECSLYWHDNSYVGGVPGEE